MTDSQKQMPSELAEFLDGFVEDKLKRLRKEKEKLNTDKEDDAVRAETLEASIARIERNPYASAIEIVLGWNPKTGRTGQPKVLIGTHVGKFSSPRSGVVIMADNVAEIDGFVRSGNFVRKPDVCPKTGAADLPTAKFLACEVGGVPMHVHIMEGDEVAQALCSVTDNPEQTLDALRGLVEESDRP